jgi:hypothetical protein
MDTSMYVSTCVGVIIPPVCVHHRHHHHSSSQDTLDAILADKSKLTSILTYHVVGGSVTAADVMKVDR